ncbi:tetratricopeptide repeat protein [Streptomyces sp. SID14515]|uniref:P-loop NTPase n=1 Tax=Streptomyces sp. SID14515 TaxID=2706074 RepID=UPI001943B6DD
MDSSWIGGHNIQIGEVTGDLSILLERPSFRLELLSPAQSPGPPTSVRHQPSYLLHPGNRVVPYSPPIADLRALTVWRDGPESLSVLLLHGPGGQGKTRTAQHFASRTAADGWSVAQARDLTTPVPALPLARGEIGEQLLIVVDYAERWRYTSLLEMLASVRSAGRDHTVRVLLLARSHTHLWDQLEAELDGLGIAFAPPAALTGFPERSRETLFHEAAASFAQALELPGLSPPAPDDLAAPSYASPLTLHMAALAAVVAAGNDDGRPGDISRYLLLHEQRRWNASTDADTMRALVALATLVGPFATRNSARELLIAAGVTDGQAEANRALTAHRLLYPGDQHLVPLRPDRFAEDFLGWYLGRDDEFADDLAMLLLGGEVLRDGDVRQALLVLANAARHEAVRDLLDRVIIRRPELAETSPALMLAVAEHLSLGTVLVVAIRPDPGVELAYARLKLTQRIVEAVPEGESDAGAILVWGMLGSRLLACGENVEAARVLGEAVRLARENLDLLDITSLAELIDLLNLYSEAIGRMGGNPIPITAEAIQILRDHADEAARRAGEDATTYKAALAKSLSNHAKALVDSGDPQGSLTAALEAEELYQELAARNIERFTPASVRATARIASLMHELDRPHEAVQFGIRAADALRRLSADDPPTHQPDYASTLHNLGLSLGQVGRTGEAAAALAKAAVLLRHLAEHVPLRYREELGGCLFALVGVLEEVETTDELIKVRRELVGVERQLREAGISQDDRRFAITMVLLGQNLVSVTNYAQALPVLTEAIELLHTAFPVFSDALITPLAQTYVNLSQAQNGLEDRSAAADSAREAVRILRALTTDSDCSEGSDDFDAAVGQLGLAWEQLAFCLPEGDPERAAAWSEFHRIFGADPQEAEDHAEERSAPDT